MSKLFHQVITLAAEGDAHNRPVCFLYKDERKKVAEILEQWRVTQSWWMRPVEREYFRVKTEKGMICELYRDLLTGAWYLQRIYD